MNGFTGMRHGFDIDSAIGVPGAVAVLHCDRASATLTPLLAELDPNAVSAVLWHGASRPADDATLHDVTHRSGFRLEPCADGTRLVAGRLYLPPADGRVWFEGHRLRMGLQPKHDLHPFDRVLRSLAQVWGHRSMLIAPDRLVGDGERGLDAVRQAGGVVRVAFAADPDDHPCTPAAAPPEAPASMRVPKSRRSAAPSFRVQRFFPFSSGVLARVQAAAELAVQRAAARDRVRVWVPACKTGGLVYAIAMLLREACAQQGSDQRVQVFGTDHDEEALAVARAGRYPAQTALGMAPRLREFYLCDEGPTIRVAEALRDVCVFSSHKLTRNAPFSRMDLIVCQRVFEGLPPGHRDDVVEELHLALRDEGVLFALDHRHYFQNDLFELMPEGYLERRPGRAPAPRAMLQRSVRSGGAAAAATPRASGPGVPSLLAGPAPTSPSPAKPDIELLVQAIDVPLLLLDGELRVLHLSDEAIRRFGLSRADRGSPLAGLLARLPGRSALLEAAERAALTGNSREIAIGAGARTYLARVSAGQRARGRSVAIVFTDVSALEAATDRALLQRHQQAAVARLGELALGSMEPPALYQEALALLFGNLPACRAGVILERTGAETLSVVGSRGLGARPLDALRGASEAYELIERVLQRATSGLDPKAETRAWSSTSAERRSIEALDAELSLGSVLPSIEAGLAWPILNEGALIGIIALYSRHGGIEGVEHHPFVQGVANVLGGAVARQRTRDRIALELAVSNVAASALDLPELGHGVAQALREALAADAVELWMAHAEPAPDTWRCAFPDTATMPAVVPWPAELLNGTAPVYRAASAPGQPHELWLPVSGRTRPLAVLRALGAALGPPHRELCDGLEHGARMLASFFERLEMLRALRQSEASHRQSNAELEALYASLPVGVTVHDRSGAVRRVHLSPAEASGDGDDTAWVTQLYADEMPRWIARVLGTGEAIRDLELSVSHAGVQRSWLCNLAAIRDLEGTVSGATAVVHDITLLKQVEAGLREADRRKDDFLALLGHELRNPIAAIRNATELLGRIEAPTPQLPQLQKILDRQTLQTTKLIDGLLDLARITRGKIELEKAPLELVELVHHAVEDRRHQFWERRLELELPSHEVWLEADRARLMQVLDNLLSNALKFTRPGGLVRVAVQSTGGRGALCVSDDGMGIEAALLPSIFEPFRQGRGLGLREQGGLGLGLALVKGVAELHGFQLSAYSAGASAGAQFRIEFATVAAAARRRPESYIDARRLRLLLVEDNDDVAETLSDLLASEGHDVQRAGSAEAALRLLPAARPDVVLCDIGLPDMNGLMLADRIRSNPESKHVKLVAMTGYGDAATRQRIEASAFDRHLIKPVRLDALAQCLERLSAAPVLRHQRG